MEHRQSWKDGRTLDRVLTWEAKRRTHSAPDTYTTSFHADPREDGAIIAMLQAAYIDGGATVDRDYRPVTPAGETPFAIGGALPGREVAYDVNRDGWLTLARNFQQFVTSSGRFAGIDTYYGVWIEPGANGADLWSFDIVTFHGARDAGIVARARAQRAVYDYVTGTVFNVTDDGGITPAIPF